MELKLEHFNLINNIVKGLEDNKDVIEFIIKSIASIKFELIWEKALHEIKSIKKIKY